MKMRSTLAVQNTQLYTQNTLVNFPKTTFSELPPGEGFCYLRKVDKGVMMSIPYNFHGVYKMRDRYNYSRAERKQMIIVMFAVEIEHGRTAPMSHYAIAKKLKMRGSTHLLGIIKEMVREELLTEYSAPKNGRWNRHAYMLPKGSYSAPRKSRKIALNVKGKEVAQLEMFS